MLLILLLPTTCEFEAVKATSSFIEFFGANTEVATGGSGRESLSLCSRTVETSFSISSPPTVFISTGITDSSVLIFVASNVSLIAVLTLFSSFETSGRTWNRSCETFCRSFNAGFRSTTISLSSFIVSSLRTTRSIANCTLYRNFISFLISASSFAHTAAFSLFSFFRAPIQD